MNQTEFLQQEFAAGLVPLAYSAFSDAVSRDMRVLVRVREKGSGARAVIDLRFDPGHVPEWLRLDILTFCGGPNA